MLFTKLRAALAVVLMVGFLGTGATILTYRTTLAQGNKPPAAEGVKVPKAKETEKEDFTAWGQAVGGLQAGLGLRPGERRAYHHGETVALVVRVRNVGKVTVKFEYLRQFLDENPPTVTDADGKTIPQGGPSVLGFHVPVEVTLAPGKQITLESRIHGASGVRFELLPAGGGGKRTTKEWPLFVGTGKVSLQYERVLGNSSAGSIQLDPTLSQLATGKLELEIKPDPSAPPAAAEKADAPPAADWGDPAGGVKIRARVVKPTWGADEKPAVELDLHNEQAGELAVGRRPTCEIEVDGVWYVPAPHTRLVAGYYAVRQGETHERFAVLSLEPDQWVRKSVIKSRETKEAMKEMLLAFGDPKNRLQLPPGKHTIRAAYEQAVSKPVEIEVVDSKK